MKESRWCRALLVRVHWDRWRVQCESLFRRMERRNGHSHGSLAEEFGQKVPNQTSAGLEENITTQTFHGKVVRDVKGSGVWGKGHGKFRKLQ